jgi:uncharacterized protein (DUF2147 family)
MDYPVFLIFGSHQAGGNLFCNKILNMKITKIILPFLLMIGSVNLLAQSQVSIDKIMGSWKTSDSLVIVVTKEGANYIAKIGAIAVDKKVLCKSIVMTQFGKELGPIKYKGIAIHPADGKEYEATIYLGANKKRLSSSYYVGTYNYRIICIR